MLRLPDGCETFSNCRSVPLSSLKILTLCTISCGFYGPPNAENCMRELCTFSQIRSHMYVCMYVHMLCMGMFVYVYVCVNQAYCTKLP